MSIIYNNLYYYIIYIIYIIKNNYIIILAKLANYLKTGLCDQITFFFIYVLIAARLHIIYYLFIYIVRIGLCLMQLSCELFFYVVIYMALSRFKK